MKTHVDSVASKPGYMAPPFQDVKKPEPTKTRLKQQADLARKLPRTTQDKQPSSPEPQPTAQAPVSPPAQAPVQNPIPVPAQPSVQPTPPVPPPGHLLHSICPRCHPKTIQAILALANRRRVDPTTQAAASSPDTIVPAQPVTSSSHSSPNSFWYTSSYPSFRQCSHSYPRIPRRRPRSRRRHGHYRRSACRCHYAVFPRSLQYTPRYTFHADEPGYLQYYCYTRFCRRFSF